MASGGGKMASDAIDFATDTASVTGGDGASSPDNASAASAASSSASAPTSARSASPPRVPTFRSTSDPADGGAAAHRLPATSMTASSTPLGMLSNARRPAPSSSASKPGGMTQDMQAKMRAFHQSRQGAPMRPSNITHASTGQLAGAEQPSMSNAAMGIPAGFQIPANLRPHAKPANSAPVVPKMGGGLSARRGLKLPGGLPGASPMGGGGAADGGDAGGNKAGGGNNATGSAFNKFSDIVDTKTGTLKFAGKAVIHGHGIDFTNGNNFSISLDEVDTLEELGKGNYGTVYKVRHARPRIRRPGMGLAGNRVSTSSSVASVSPTSASHGDDASSPVGSGLGGSSTGVVMAMKELRLELDEAKFAAIIMELDILHRCLSPYIIDFYGAFFQEGAVYICIEFMDGGSIDKIYGDGIPEGVLRKITYATTQGLKTLKDDHNIIHRDVKPTNILVNTRGQIKICDFGVSGNLVASIAKTNIGCQSYMAPERISGGGIGAAGAVAGGAPGGTYSVQSDIWSLGLTIIECALGRYPYPPETYNNIFSQLSAIVDGDPPDLPEEGFSDLARDFVRGCLNKIPKLRPTYQMLLSHGWLASLSKPATIEEEEEPTSPSPESPPQGSGIEERIKGLALGGGEAEKMNETPLNMEKPFIGTEDREVAAWVVRAMDRKKKGLMGKSEVPALHKVAMDAPGGK